MTSYFEEMISPVVLLERLPIKSKQTSGIKEEVIISKSENELKHRNNRIKFKAMKKKKTRFKNPYEKTAVCAISKKSEYTDIANNVVFRKLKINLMKLKDVDTKVNSTRNSGIYKLRKNKFQRNKSEYKNILRSPIVVLERLPLKTFPNLINDEKAIIPMFDYIEKAPNMNGEIYNKLDNEILNINNCAEEREINCHEVNIDNNVNIIKKTVNESEKNETNLENETEDKNISEEKTHERIEIENENINKENTYTETSSPSITFEENLADEIRVNNISEMEKREDITNTDSIDGQIVVNIKSNNDKEVSNDGLTTEEDSSNEITNIPIHNNIIEVCTTDAKIPTNSMATKEEINKQLTINIDSDDDKKVSNNGLTTKENSRNEMTYISNNNRIEVCSTDEKSIHDTNEIEESQANLMAVKEEIDEHFVINITDSDGTEILNDDVTTETPHSDNEIESENTNENNLLYVSNVEETDNLNGNLITEESPGDEIKADETKENELQCANEPFDQTHINLNFVQQEIIIGAVNEENVCNNTQKVKNKSISLEQACEQMAMSELYMFETSFDQNLLYISGESDDEIDADIDDIQTADNNQNLQEYVEIAKEQTLNNRKNKMPYYREKCIKCNKVQKRINNKASSKCQTCEEHVHYECVQCNKEYKYISGIYKHIVVNHVKSDDSKKPFKCSRCGREFSLSFHINDHLRYCMVAPHLQCAFCPVKIKRRSSLRNHFLTQHRNKIAYKEVDSLVDKIVNSSKELEEKMHNGYSSTQLQSSSSRQRPFPIRKFIKLYCEDCNEISEKLYGKDQRSCRTCRAKLQLQCSKCGRRYKYRSSMSIHLRNQCLQMQPIIVQCEQCDYVTHTKSRLDRHIKRRHTWIHPSNFVACQCCGKKFRLKEDLRNHMVICGKKPHLRCNMCDYVTKHASVLRDHLERKHQKTWIPEIQAPAEVQVAGDQTMEIAIEDIKVEPDLSASNNDTIDHSLNILNEDSTFVSDSIKACCQACESEIRAMEKITKCQLCSTPFFYSCSHCNEIKYSFVQVRLHVIRKHAEKIYTCDNSCGRKFYEYDFRQHLKICGKEPHLRCERCSFQTKYKTTLQSHMERGNCTIHKNRQTAENARVYCHKCGKNFRSQMHMSKHVNFCGLPKPILSCEHCSFKTKQKHMMVSHIQSKHAARLFRNIDAFQCGNCTLMFKNYFVYSRHADVCRGKKIQLSCVR